MPIQLIDLMAQHKTIQKEIEDAIKRVIDKTAFVGGEEMTGFENEFAAFCGVKYGVSVSSGSTALDLALLALGVGKDDEVITTPCTFIATTEAITHVGAKVVFAEVEPDTYNIDVKEIEKKITPKTKAIIPVHLFGHACDMEPMMEIAKKHNLIVLEDAAQAHGAKYKDKTVGQFGAATCFSFYPGKNLGSYGHAGIVISDDKAIADRVKLLANHGREDKYEHQMEGFNYRADSIQTAVLRVKLRHLADWNEKRRKIASIYNSILKNVTKPTEKDYAKHVYHLYVIQVKNRDGLAAHLKSKGILTGIHYPIPLHLQPAYSYLGHKKGSFPISESFCDNALSLPMYPELAEDQVKLIAEEVNNFTK